MQSEQEIQKLIQEAKEGALTGYAFDRLRYALYLLVDPKSDYKQCMLGMALLKQASAQDYVFAQGELAYRLYYGEGIAKDEKLALKLCNKALEKYIDPKWLRLRDVITKPKNFLASNAQMALYRAFIHRDISYIEPRLDENVIFSDLLRYPTPGKNDVMELLQECVSNKEIQTSLVSTERFGMITETFVPNNVRTMVRSLYFIRTNAANKIDRIARQPIVWGEYSFNVGSMPFLWKEIEPCLDNVDTKFDIGLMFCMQCGKLSHELKWIRFHSDPRLHNGYSYIGRMSVCPDCRQQVEFHCEDCEKIL